MKKLLTLLFTISCITSIQAQIVYHDIDPDTTIDDWEVFSVWPDPPTQGSVDIWFHPFSPNQVVVNTWDACDVLWDGQYPAKLDQGAPINSSATWNAADYDTLNVDNKGHWIDGVTDKYLAFRFMKSGQWHYGWIRLDVTDTPSSFTIKDYAFNNTAGAAINAGDRAAAGITTLNTENFRMAVQDHIVSFPQLHEGIPCRAAVYDVNGRILIQSELHGNRTLNLQTYPAGIYFVQLDLPGSSRRLKLYLP